MQGRSGPSGAGQAGRPGTDGNRHAGQAATCMRRSSPERLRLPGPFPLVPAEAGEVQLPPPGLRCRPRCSVQRVAARPPRLVTEPFPPHCTHPGPSCVRPLSHSLQTQLPSHSPTLPLPHPPHQPTPHPILPQYYLKRCGVRQVYYLVEGDPDLLPTGGGCCAAHARTWLVCGPRPLVSLAARALPCLLAGCRPVWSRPQVHGRLQAGFGPRTSCVGAACCTKAPAASTRRLAQPGCPPQSRLRSRAPACPLPSPPPQSSARRWRGPRRPASKL